MRARYRSRAHFRWHDEYLRFLAGQRKHEPRGGFYVRVTGAQKAEMRRDAYKLFVKMAEALGTPLGELTQARPPLSALIERLEMNR